MKSLSHALLLSSLLCAGATAAETSDKLFLGPIPVQYVVPNEDIIIDMHRFFNAPGRETLELPDLPGVVVTYNPVSFELRARVSGPGLFEIEIEGERTGASDAASKSATLKTVLTLASSSKTIGAQHFSFKPTSGTISKVFLAGSFNGWSTDKLPLAGPGADGSYSADVPLKPGRYAYKFVVDGNWTIDPANAQSEDNGLGDKNSVVIVSAEQGAEAPTIYADKMTDKALIVRGTRKSDEFSTVSAVWETAGGAARIPSKNKAGEIEVPLPKGRDGFIRVIAASKDGRPSNVVRVPLNKTAFRWQDAVLYYAFTDRFADGDQSNDKPVDNPNVLPPANYHGGDLRGITQKIEQGYFQKLGANTIWVAPLNQNPAGAYQESPEPHRWYTGYHGYWPISSTELDPHVGKKADLQKLVETAHTHGMKVIADLVLHHVHEEHPWWKQHRDWFGSLELPDGRKNLRLWDEQQFTTWFEPYLPSFDFSKPAPVNALIENSIWWANTYKLDGFRLDAVKHILPSFWWKFRAALREKVQRPADSPLYLVGETFKDRPGIMTFVGPNMLDGQFDFPLYDQIKDTFGENKGGMQALDDGLTASEKIYGKETLMSPLVGNHDKGRFMAYADGDLPGPDKVKDEEVGWQNPPIVNDPDNYGKLELAQAFLMAIDGVPMVYYGDEIGMTGAGDPDNRRDMRFGDQVTGDEKLVFDNFGKLGRLRHDHPALRYGSRRTVECSNDVYAFVRAQLDDRIVAIFNRSNAEAKVNLTVGPELADGDYTEALRGATVAVKDGLLSMTLPARSAGFVGKK